MTEPIELTDLVIEEGSGVDKGDNPEAFVRLLKRDEAKPSAWETIKAWAGKLVHGEIRPHTTDEIMRAGEFQDAFGKLRHAFMESVGSILSFSEPDEMGPVLARSVDEFAARARALAVEAGQAEKLAPLLDRLIESVPAAVEKMRRDDLVAALEAIEGFGVQKQSALGNFLRQRMEEQEVSTSDLARAAGIEESTVNDILAGNITRPPDQRLRGFARALDVSFDRLLNLIPAAEREKAQEEDVSDKTTPPEAAAKPAEKAEEMASAEDLRKARAEAEDLRKRIARLEDEKATAEYVAKARTLAGKTAGVDVAKLGGVLKSAHAASTDLGGAVEEIVGALVAQLDKSNALVRATGSSAPEPSSAEARLDAAAREIMKSAAERGERLPFAVAYDRAMTANPELARDAVGSAN